MNYTLIRSNRRTMAAQIKDCQLIIRAPRYASREEIDAFVEKCRPWITKHLLMAEEKKLQSEQEPKLSMQQIQELAQKALEYIPERVQYYAPIVGVTYGRITIRNQRSRWGSCSSKGNLNFNCLLMLTPPEVIDSVVVHELCHRKEMNHSPRFYAEVLRVLPNYYELDKWLKEHGPALMARME